MKEESLFPSLRSEVDRLFEHLAHAAWKGREAEWTPALDVTEERDLYRIEMDLPGVRGPDISITTQGATLRVEGFRSRARRSTSERQHLVEREFGRFRRTIGLPSHVDPDRIRVRLADGVLTVEIPKAGSRSV